MKKNSTGQILPIVMITLVILTLIISGLGQLDSKRFEVGRQRTEILVSDQLRGSRHRPGYLETSKHDEHLDRSFARNRHPGTIISTPHSPIFPVDVTG